MCIIVINFMLELRYLLMHGSTYQEEHLVVGAWLRTPPVWQVKSIFILSMLSEINKSFKLLLGKSELSLSTETIFNFLFCSSRYCCWGVV